MVMIYGEALTVDMKHADIAYKQFDVWKGMGYNPYLSMSGSLVKAAYEVGKLTFDNKTDGGDEESNMAS